jgi:hypothetical protein
MKRNEMLRAASLGWERGGRWRGPDVVIRSGSCERPR